MCQSATKISLLATSIPDNIFTRDSIYAIARICRTNSVCLSVTRVICIKRLNVLSKFFHHLIGLSFLFFDTKGRCVNLTASPPTWVPNTRGGSNFRPICSYISETVIDRGIVTMEDEYKVACALSNSATFDDLDLPRTLV